jgi:hypothetical protein
MNERIRELWNQSRYPSGRGHDEQKFAELIVRECATAITNDDLAKDCGTFMMDSWAKGMRYSAHLIKEYFGVEQ